jgi:hypothetical protein
MRRIIGVLAVVSALSASSPCAASDDGELPGTAWDAVVAADPAAGAGVDPVLRSIMTRLSPAEYARLVEGVDPAEIELLDGRRLDVFLKETTGLGGGFAIPFFSIDAGGRTSTGGTFRVEGTLGQPDTSIVMSGDLTLISFGGFRQPLGPSIFADGFESGDTSEWSNAVP